jgi:hypothetical protein
MEGWGQQGLGQEDNKRIQRLIEWRIEAHRMDERLLLESIEKEERLEGATKLKTQLIGHREKDIEMDWRAEDDCMEVDWLEAVTQEQS